MGAHSGHRDPCSIEHRSKALLKSDSSGLFFLLRRLTVADARTSTNGEPNSHTALFDLAIPGSQPVSHVCGPENLRVLTIVQVFQTSTLLAALRAAVALDCDIQRTSKFDRKHYFYQDQPAGYQITQYYGTNISEKASGIFTDDSRAFGKEWAYNVIQP